MNIAFSELPELVAIKIIKRSRLNHWRSHIKEQTAEMELTFHYEEADAAIAEQRVGAALNHLSRCETLIKKTRFRDKNHAANWLDKIAERKKPLLISQRSVV